MDEKKGYEHPVPFLVHEYDMARFERTVRRLWVVVILCIIALFATNALWLYWWNQYDYSDVTVDSRDDGIANYMQAGANGVINNAKNSSQEEGQEE